MRHDLERPRRTAVILDPQPLVHTAMRTVLAPLNIELVGATTSIRTAETLLREHRPDLFLAEVDFDGRHDEVLGVLEMARVDEPELNVIVLSGADDPVLVDAAFDRGASAYVLKTSTTETIATAISQAFEPSVYLSRPRNDRTPALQGDGAVLRKLTRREIEILQLVSGGRSNRQVAEILFVTDQTVKFHLANVYRKLGVRSRYEAASWAREHGLVDATAAANVVALPKPGARAGSEERPVLVPLRQPLDGKKVASESGETSR
jgi:two-component system nitrate/nitrite response regulator NarP